MTDAEKIARLTKIILEEVAQLERWAEESRRGGWSTHQVKPQQQRARDLAYELIRVVGL